MWAQVQVHYIAADLSLFEIKFICLSGIFYGARDQMFLMLATPWVEYMHCQILTATPKIPNGHIIENQLNEFYYGHQNFNFNIFIN